ncbi:MAG: type II toxin-antitoxin system VapC family toxin [Actinomycetota bacterium]|nr:type II toxin-antitoxin system VapC family toxin [Actinomycetota bacterium]
MVKLYADEQDHHLVRGQGSLIVSALARVEVPAAIWRKHRIGELDPADAAVLVAAFEADYHGSTVEQPRFSVVATTAAILETAARLVGVHGLRAYDAVQLASAKATAEAIPDCRTVAFSAAHSVQPPRKRASRSYRPDRCGLR